MVRGVLASVGPAINAVNVAGLVEGKARVLGGDGFLVACGLDVQGTLKAAGCAFFFAEDEGEIGAGAGAELRVVHGTDDATGSGRAGEGAA